MKFQIVHAPLAKADKLAFAYIRVYQETGSVLEARASLRFEMPRASDALFIATVWQIEKDFAIDTTGHPLEGVEAARKTRTRARKAKLARQARHEAYDSAGMVKVQGNLGGIYWE